MLKCLGIISLCSGSPESSLLKKFLGLKASSSTDFSTSILFDCFGGIGCKFVGRFHYGLPDKCCSASASTFCFSDFLPSTFCFDSNCSCFPSFCQSNFPSIPSCRRTSSFPYPPSLSTCSAAPSASGLLSLLPSSLLNNSSRTFLGCSSSGSLPFCSPTSSSFSKENVHCRSFPTGSSTTAAFESWWPFDGEASTRWFWSCRPCPRHFYLLQLLHPVGVLQSIQSILAVRQIRRHVADHHRFAVPNETVPQDHRQL